MILESFLCHVIKSIREYDTLMYMYVEWNKQMLNQHVDDFFILHRITNPQLRFTTVFSTYQHVFSHRLKLTWIVNVYSCFLTIYTSGPFEMKSSISISALVVLAFALMSEAEEKEEGPGVSGIGVRDAIQ